MTESSVLILTVDDEPMILETLEHVLEDAGFAVTRAGSGEAAIALLDGGEHAFRALLTDVNLVRAGKTGWDVAQRARERFAGIPVVYMTGASAHEWTSHGVPHSVLLTKPFAMAQVVAAVTALLNAGAVLPAPPPASPAP